MSAARLVAAFGLGGFASSAAARALDPLVGVVALDLGAAVDEVALLATAFALPYALIQPFLGPVGDALGKKRVVLACLAALVLALLLCAAAPSLGALFSARVLSGAAAGGVFPLTLALFGDRIPLASRQVAISRFLGMALAGQMSGGLLAGLLEPVLGWRGVLLLCAALTALAVLVLGLLRLPPEEGRPLSLTASLTRYAELLRHPLARACYLAVFCEGVLIFGVLPFTAPLLEARGLGAAREAGIALAGFGAGGLAYTLAAPVFVARLGPPRMLALGGWLCGGALLGVGLAPHWSGVALAMVVLGCGFFLMHNSIQTRVTEVAPAARGSAVALHAFSYFLGQSLAPAAFAAGLAGFGALPTLAMCAGGVVLLGLVMRNVVADQNAK
jgi:predicted MFS family arabinose efflux permease